MQPLSNDVDDYCSTYWRWMDRMNRIPHVGAYGRNGTPPPAPYLVFVGPRSELNVNPGRGLCPFHHCSPVWFAAWTQGC